MKVEVSHVYKTIKSRPVLRDVNMTFSPGKIYGLQGINGSGKTMLLRLISGLVRPSKGQILIDGKELGKRIEFPKSMGLLIENPAFIGAYSAFENIKLLSSISQRVSDEDIREAIVMVGLDPDDRLPYKKFSLGMKQRLGIAISLLGNPDFLILDEPINGLDPEGVYEIRKMLETLNRQYGTTIMIASHILSELHKLATDYAIIDGRRLIDEFSKETLEKACSSDVQVTVEPGHLEGAKTLIASRYPDVRYEVLSDQSLRLYEKIDLADLNQFLVENKVRVCGLGANDEDIERFFVEKLSGGQAV